MKVIIMMLALLAVACEKESATKEVQDVKTEEIINEGEQRWEEYIQKKKEQIQLDTQSD